MGDYRFGFNGKEKTNEISGIGNHNTAEFWEYDTRLGRRWNVDFRFKEKPNISPFATNSNNPIWYMDPLGDLESTDVIKQYGTNEVVGAKNDGDNNVYVVNNEIEKKRTGEVIAETLSPFDFILTDDGKGSFDKNASININLDQLKISSEFNTGNTHLTNSRI